MKSIIVLGVVLTALIVGSTAYWAGTPRYYEDWTKHVDVYPQCGWRIIGVCWKWRWKTCAIYFHRDREIIPFAIVADFRQVKRGKSPVWIQQRSE
jgi:hypothetical protein